MRNLDDLTLSVEVIERRLVTRVNEWAAGALNGAIDSIALTPDVDLPGAALAIGWWQDRGFPAVWDDPDASAVMADYCWEVTDQLLSGLATTLDEFHGTQHGPVYWKMILASWALIFVSTVVDHRLACLAAQSIAPGTPFLTCASETPPHTAEAWLLGMLQPHGKHHFLSRLVETMGLPTRVLSEDKVTPLKKPAEQRLRLMVSVQRMVRQSPSRTRGVLEERLAALLFGGRRGRRTQMIDCHLSFRQAMTLVLRVPGCRIGSAREVLTGRPSSDDPRSDPDWALRAQLLEIPADSETEATIVGLLPNLLPMSVLENYRQIEQESKRLYGPPCHVVHGNFRWDEIQNEFLARSYVAGRRLAFVQHGGSYGQLKVSGFGRLERWPNTEFVSWGWNGPGVIPLPSARLSRIRDRHRGGDAIAVIEGPLLEDNATMGFGSVHPGRLSEVGEFVDAIADSAIRRQVIRKPWMTRDGAAARLPPAVRLMANARIAVITYFDTPILEALAINVPLIAFWEPSAYEFAEDTMELLRAMSEVGIFYTDPTEAADAVERNYHDASRWWTQREVQQVRLEFLDRYGQSTEWGARWVAYLRRFSRGRDDTPAVLAQGVPKG